MDNKEKEFEEMDKIIYDNACTVIRVAGTCHYGEKQDGYGFTDCVSSKIAKALCDADYRKVPKGAIVLTKEDMTKYAKDCIAGQETGLDIINALIARAERKAERASKTTAEAVIEKAKYESAMTFENKLHVRVCKMLDKVLQQYTEEFK